jgi:glycerophosphoryl diester phosphodiesterase
MCSIAALAVSLVFFLNGCASHSSHTCPLVAAHRSGAREVGLPDNSSAALQRALVDGLSYLEVDLRLTRDGVAFLFHDSRLTSRDWKVPNSIRGRRVSMIKASDMRSVCSAVDGNQCVLTLSDGLDIIQGSGATLQVDLKGDLSDYQIASLVEMISRRGLERQVILFCDPVTELHRVRTLAPAFKLMGRAYTEQELKDFLSVNPYAVQVDEELVDSVPARSLRTQGVLIMIKTLDELGDTPHHWRRLQLSGVDIILTDLPRAAHLELCGERPQRVKDTE